MDRVFVDTNVLLSGLIFKGNESRLLEMAMHGEIRLVVAEVVIAESRRVLQAKFPDYAHVLDEFLSLLDYELAPVPDEKSVAEAKGLLRDPFDAPILAAAIAVKPDLILSGDKDLLTPEIAGRFNIKRCAEYLAEWMGQ